MPIGSIYCKKLGTSFSLFYLCQNLLICDSVRIGAQRTISLIPRKITFYTKKTGKKVSIVETLTTHSTPLSLNTENMNHLSMGK